MINLTGTHDCYQCGENFNWQCRIRTSKSSIDSYSARGSQGKGAFVDKGVVQVTVPCSRCTADNIFETDVK